MWFPGLDEGTAVTASRPVVICEIDRGNCGLTVGALAMFVSRGIPPDPPQVSASVEAVGRNIGQPPTVVGFDQDRDALLVQRWRLASFSHDP